MCRAGPGGCFVFIFLFYLLEESLSSIYILFFPSSSKESYGVSGNDGMWMLDVPVNGWIPVNVW